jgi:CDP-diacylglycerol--inositol 3-phosphatidyltransferase
MLAFQLLLGLDLSSHYMHMYASLSAGATSHKAIDNRQHWLLRAYYHYQSVLFVVCAGNELFFLGLYLMHHYPREATVLSFGGVKMNKYEILTAVVTPVFLFKQFMNVVQLIGAAKRLAMAEKKSKD